MLRLACAGLKELQQQAPEVRLEVSGKRGISAFRFRKYHAGRAFHAFRGQADASTRSTCSPTATWRIFSPAARPAGRGLHEIRESQPPVCRGRNAVAPGRSWKGTPRTSRLAKSQYEFLPSAESIVDEVVPASFKVKLFKCFLDAAVSEQIARMVAMKDATENADSMIAQPVDGLQPRPARADHQRTAGDHRRGGGT